MQRKDTLKVALLDLNHTTTGLHTATMPLGIGLLASYLLEKLPKGSIDVKLYKFTEDFMPNLEAEKIDIVGFTMYAWNTNLNLHFAKLVKQKNPNAVVVCGGPNISYQDEWVRNFLLSHSFIDYVVPFNGEIPLLGIVESILFENSQKNCSIEGAYYLEGDKKHLIFNELQTKLDNLDLAPSPYLLGLMDKFFPSSNSESPFNLAPFIETNRGCPYRCTFCHTANLRYSKIITKENDTFKAEMEIFAERMKDYPDVPLYIADNNFGMYKRDNEIADIIRGHQDSSNWPVYIDVTVGKSQVKNILQVMKRLKPGTLNVFMSSQTMNKEVLKNIKRRNLSSEEFEYFQHGLLEAAQEQSSSQKSLSSSGVIIGLPGETRETFFQGAEEIINLGIDSFIAYTLMVLKGTPVADEIREQQDQYIVKNRIVPQQFGKYGDTLILDTEEVAVGTPTMTYEDYLECRSLCFFLQVVYGNDLYQNHIHLLRKYSCSVYQWIIEIMETVKKDQGKLGELFQSFYDETRNELWDSEEEVHAFFENEENYIDLKEGNYGTNLMAKYSFLSRVECFEEWIEVVSRTCEEFLMKKIPRESEKIEITKYLAEFKEYSLRIKNIGSFFEEGFKAEPFTINSQYDFSEIDPSKILKKNKKLKKMTYSFSDTSKGVINNMKESKNWRYKLQQLIRIKNAAESLYPKNYVEDDKLAPLPNVMEFERTTNAETFR